MNLYLGVKLGRAKLEGIQQNGKGSVSVRITRDFFKRNNHLNKRGFYYDKVLEIFDYFLYDQPNYSCLGLDGTFEWYLSNPSQFHEKIIILFLSRKDYKSLLSDKAVTYETYKNRFKILLKDDFLYIRKINPRPNKQSECSQNKQLKEAECSRNKQKSFESVKMNKPLRSK